MAFSGSLPQNFQDVGACAKPKPDALAFPRLQAWFACTRAWFSLSLLTLTTLCFMGCGAVTSSSPRCHPAGEGFRRARPLPKPHSTTSAIHKRQPLSLCSLAHTACDPPPSSSLTSKVFASPLFLPSLLPRRWFYSWIHHFLAGSLRSPVSSPASSGKSSHPLCLQWEPSECSGNGVGTAGPF